MVMSPDNHPHPLAWHSALAIKLDLDIVAGLVLGLALALVPSRKPTPGDHIALASYRSVLPVPPEAVRLHGGCAGIRALVMLAREIKRPHRLPVIHRHIDGMQGGPDLLQPRFVFVSHTPPL